MANFLSKNYKHCLLGLFISLVLTACGGGGGSNGVGGTGIIQGIGITQGRLSGFGSMYVNGVKFNTDNATFIRDGVGSKKQEDFNTGEIVSIKGTVNSDRTTGVATEVIFSDVLEGSVTSTPTTNSVVVLGQNVTTNSLTVFHGFNKLSELKLGNIVEVSGFSASNKIIASSIKLINSSFSEGSTLEVEGNIENLNSNTLTFEINDLLIDYSTSQFIEIDQSTIKNGDYLIISSTQDVESNVFKATKIESADSKLEPNSYYEIEGFVTDFDSSANFTLDNENNVNTSANTIISNGSLSNIKLDQLLIVIGTSNAEGVVIANEIRIIDSANSVSIEANIESIDLSNNSLVILGKTIFIDSFTLISDETTEDFVFFNLSQLAVGDSVFVDAYQSNGKTIANRLSKIDAIATQYIVGIVDSINSEQAQLTILDNTITTDNTTEFRDENDNLISSMTFFSLVDAGITEVTLSANYVANTEILATEIAILKNP